MKAVHIVPIGDVVHHDFPGADAASAMADAKPVGWVAVQTCPGDAPLARCVCGPLVETAIGERGPVQRLVTHHALDGRESREDAT